MIKGGGYIWSRLSKTVRGKGMNNYGRVLRSATLWIIFFKIPTPKMKKQTLKLKFPRLKLKNPTLKFEF